MPNTRLNADPSIPENPVPVTAGPKYFETPSDEPKITIKVHAITGKSCEIVVGSVSETVWNLKLRIFQNLSEFLSFFCSSNLIALLSLSQISEFHFSGINPDQNRLLFNRRVLVHDQLLSTYGITDNSAVHVTVKMRGP